MTHTDRISAERARKQRERATRKAKGYVWRGLWVRPEVWDRVRNYTDRLNKQTERTGNDGKRQSQRKNGGASA